MITHNEQRPRNIINRINHKIISKCTEQRRNYYMSDFNLKALYGTLGNLLSSIGPGIQAVKELDSEMTDLKLSTNATTNE